MDHHPYAFMVVGSAVCLLAACSSEKGRSEKDGQDGSFSRSDGPVERGGRDVSVLKVPDATEDRTKDERLPGIPDARDSLSDALVRPAPDLVEPGPDTGRTWLLSRNDPGVLCKNGPAIGR